MIVLPTHVDTTDDTFQSNRQRRLWLWTWMAKAKPRRAKPASKKQQFAGDNLQPSNSRVGSQCITNEIAVDPGSGASQEYIEDCQVCCQPWRVTLSYDETGAVHVHLDAADDA